ncbi:hypothetical protein [Sphingomonas japonica]|uniref:Uncharacterized protein n=1 Tax=Sphingomonas japonica TaxID=511662 RepID=A0ABX0U0V2_9SPHN|nr:hypothetical protein [Sphingomonas japonica]NIJ24200.1 hypothetical protein [Sphingomonas japonica]
MEDPTKNMSVEDALFYWMTKKDPWLINKKHGRFPYKYSIDPNSVEINPVGFVTKMPALSGVPCFGQPAPYLRFFYTWIYQSSSGKARPGRCRTCALNAACRKIVMARCASNDTLNELAIEYVNARKGLSYASLRNGEVKAKGYYSEKHRDQYDIAKKIERRASTYLRYELQQYRWPSVNDRKGTAETWEANRAALAAARKARQRQMRRGLVPEAYRRAVAEGAEHRELILKNYVQQPNADHRTKRLPMASLSRDVMVWKMAEELRLSRAAVTAYAIARQAGAEGTELNRTRQWVARSLGRIIRYESEILLSDGSPLWERFNPEEWIARR